jgi:two-component system, probable response regulator PhcQ
MMLGLDHKQFAVLFVDDEEQSRKYFRMAFEEDFQVLTAASVEEAWSVFAPGGPPVGVLVTDQRMPQQSGTELLARVRRERPDVIRVLTTAYADLDAVIEAVNTGAIYRYVVKPWDIRDLRNTLRQAMEYFLLRRERDLLVREKLSALQQLLVADRIRSFEVLAEGLSTRVRDTMIALRAYVDICTEQLETSLPAVAAQTSRSWSNMRAEVEDAHRHMLKIIRSVAQTTVECRYDFTDCSPVRALVEGGSSASRRSGAPIAIDVAPDLPDITCCRTMLQRMFSMLVGYILWKSQTAAELANVGVRIVARDRTVVWGAEGIVIDIVRAGFVWSSQLLHSLFMPAGARDEDDEGPDLLAAFFIAYHHGGTISLQSEEGAAGFRVTLPVSPEKVSRPALDRESVTELFLRLPWWDSLERGAAV